MKLYETRIAPNPRRVRMFLAEKGLLENIECVEVDLQKGENLTAEFGARNPMKKVPVLELDEGDCIAETMAICRYFELQYPDSTPLLGRGAREVAHIEQWTRWIDFYFMMPTGMCFQHSSGYFKDRMTPLPEWGEECRKGIHRFLSFLEKHLENREWIVGDTLTAADINAFVTLEFNKVNDIRLEPDQKNLAAWHERIRQRESATA
ncbi:MAG: glutathione S-transferase family protein [Pseudohongiellaceae bacterium]